MTRIDAIVPASALTLDLARELERLAPFGLGNPDVTLLVAGCEAVGPATVGEGKHLRFRVRQHGRDAGARSPSVSAASSSGYRATRASTSRSGSSRTAGTARSPRNSSCAACSIPQLDTRSYGRGWPSSGAPASRRGRRRLGGSSASSRSRAQAASGSCSNRPRSGRCWNTAYRSPCLEPPELEAWARRSAGVTTVGAPRRTRADGWVPQRCPCAVARASRALARGLRPRGGRAIDRSSSASSRSTLRRSRYRRSGPMALCSSADRSAFLSLERARVH